MNTTRSRHWLIGRRYHFRCSSKLIYISIFLNFIGFIYFFYGTSPHHQPHNKARNAAGYVTLANSDGYAMGAAVLAMSLMDTGTVVPILVLVTKSVSQGMIDILENIGCEVYKTESITLPQELSLQTERWGPAFTKLVAWKRTDFSKLVFIDSDTLVLKNIDQLFAVSDSLLAAVDTDASSCSFKEERMSMINSGILVLKPSEYTYHKLINTLHNKTLLAQGSINDQDVIVNTMPWQPLPYPIFGAQITHCECSDSRLWSLSNTKVIHFTAGLKKLPKPWDFSAQKDMMQEFPSCVKDLYKLWKKYYDKVMQINSHPNKT